MEKILTTSIVGFSLLTFLSYVFIVLNIAILIIPVTLLLLLIVIKPLIREVKGIKFRFNLQTLIIIAVFTLGILGQMAIIAPSGIYQNGDLVFWSAHGHDGPWHIALMEEIKKGYPFNHPTFSGEKLVNYHFFSDILPAMVSKYAPISNLHLYFRIFPFIYSLFLGASAYFLTKKLTKSIPASIWATIFTYFAGSFGFLVTYLKNKTIAGESIFWATQPQSSSGNPPQIISNFLVLTAFYFLITFLEDKKNKKVFFICVLLFGTLSSFKIYAGIILLLSLGILGIWQLIKNKDLQLLLLTILSGILAIALYLPNSSGSSSFLIFQPWWYIRTMIVEPSRLNLLDWELRRQTYIYEHNWKRVIFLEGIGFLIFLFGNLGMRFIGFWDLIKSTKNIFKNNFNIVLISTITLSLVLPLLFLQKGVASNTSQFLQYFVLLFGILAGISTARLTSKFKFLIPLMLLLMIPTQVGLLYEFYSRPAYSKITSSELQALKFVKDNSNPDDVILTPPYNQYLSLKDATPNIWDWFDTGYVSAFTSRRTYMDDYEQVDIMGYDYRERYEIKKLLFETKDLKEATLALNKTGADIIYFPKVQKPIIDLKEIGLIKSFENDVIEVWRKN